MKLITQKLNQSARYLGESADITKYLAAKMNIIAKNIVVQDLDEKKVFNQFQEVDELMNEAESLLKKAHNAFHSADNSIEYRMKSWKFWTRVIWDSFFLLVAFMFLFLASYERPIDVLFHFSTAVLILGALAWVYKKR